VKKKTLNDDTTTDDGTYIAYCTSVIDTVSIKTLQHSFNVNFGKTETGRWTQNDLPVAEHTNVWTNVWDRVKTSCGLSDDR
jgi:hypothetical protein